MGKPQRLTSAQELLKSIIHQKCQLKLQWDVASHTLAWQNERDVELPHEGMRYPQLVWPSQRVSWQKMITVNYVHIVDSRNSLSWHFSKKFMPRPTMEQVFIIALFVGTGGHLIVYHWGRRWLYNSKWNIRIQAVARSSALTTHTATWMSSRPSAEKLRKESYRWPDIIYVRL